MSEIIRECWTPYIKENIVSNLYSCGLIQQQLIWLQGYLYSRDDINLKNKEDAIQVARYLLEEHMLKLKKNGKKIQ